jgi:hypothetical protein
MLALHLDSLLFLLLVAVAIFFRLLARAANKTAKPTDNETNVRRITTPPSRPAPPDSDTERIRKFLDALGQPAGTAPPRRVMPRARTIPPQTVAPKPTVVRHVPPFASPLPPLTTRPPDLPPIAASETPLPPPIPAAVTARPPISTPSRAAESSAVISAAYNVVPTGDALRDDLMKLLRSPAGRRQAVILREVLGPPRSFQPLEIVGSA